MAKQQAKQTTATNPRAVENDDSEQSGISSSSASSGEAAEDHIYGLASVLYHALQGVTAARKYADDARRVGADELVEFFEECRNEGEMRAKQAKSLLVTYSEEEEDDEDADEGEDDDS
jgi:plasmid stabilization system protein ParE